MKIEIKKILCPVDFSESSENALRYALVLAKAHDASLDLYHVLELPAYSVPGDSEFAGLSFEYMKDVEQICTKRLNDMAREIREEHAKVMTTIESGEPFSSIIRKARKDEADLIVMGTHGRTGLQHVLIGSVAEKVVRKSPCPVLTVKHPEHEFVMP